MPYDVSMASKDRRPVRNRRAINEVLFDGGLRHSHIKRLLAEPGFAELAQRIQDLNPAEQTEAIASIPIASKAQRLSVANQLLWSLREVTAQRRTAALEARGLGVKLPPGADTGLVFLDGDSAGKVDTGLVREATMVLRFASEEMGEAAQIEVNVQQNFAAVDIGQVVSVLCGNAPPPKGDE